ncbi:helix-turn-helix domain-containing protein [Actinomadura madurae]|uniref:helix-turn-helix domain-containing protein n=1 Tax=Actinomadura madurae TaxID=1993 RepID=UPI0020D225B4|nr:helix-turn-helix domain-containing protein [Actinomadura madurae]MCP9971858.1 helix-turn-helix domain-containing protein [Actinomadura madurae]
MTDSGALPEILTAHCPRVAAAVREALHGHPAYQPIRRAAGPMFGGGRETCARLLGLVLAGGPLPEDDWGRFRDLGVLAARQAIPLPVLSEAWDLALAAAARTCWTIAPPGRFAEMAELTAHAARLAVGAREACIQGYAEAPREGARSRPLRRLLAETLIDGAPAGVIAEAAASAWRRRTSRCAARSPGAWRTCTGSGRRAARIVGGRAVLRRPVRPRRAVPRRRPAARRGPGGRVHRRARRLRAGAGARRRVVPARRREHPRRAGGGVPGADDRQGHPGRRGPPLPGGRAAGRARHPRAARHPRRLAAVLSPLDAGTDLRRTLEVLLACNLDRERAARELWIHRRTLHYRLDRIRDLSGVDPSSARGIQLFRAALTSARLAGLERDGHRAQDASLPPPLSA